MGKLIKKSKWHIFLFTYSAGYSPIYSSCGISLFYLKAQKMHSKTTARSLIRNLDPLTQDNHRYYCELFDEETIFFPHIFMQRRAYIQSWMKWFKHCPLWWKVSPSWVDAWFLPCSNSKTKTYTIRWTV